MLFLDRVISRLIKINFLQKYLQDYFLIQINLAFNFAIYAIVVRFNTEHMVIAAQRNVK